MNRYSFKYIIDTRIIKKGLAQIYFRVTVDRKKCECAISEWVDPVKFDLNAGRINKPNRYEKFLNEKLTRIENQINEYRWELEKEGKLTARAIKELHLYGRRAQSTPLLEFFDRQVQEMVKRRLHADNTLKHYTICRDKLFKYLQSTSAEDISVENWGLKNVHGFYNYMLESVSVNTAINNMRKLRAILNGAIKSEIININPFSRYRMICTPTNRVALTAEELKTITDYPLENESLKKVRQMFLFSCYSGLRYKDAANLTIDKIKVDSNGRYWIETIQEKTNRPVLIPVIGPAKEIIENNKSYQEMTGKVLPMISNQKINTYLKVIANLTGISKNISHHVARHTYCTTILLENGVDIKSIQSLAGHGSMASTIIYSKTTRKVLSDVADRVEEALFNYDKES